MERPPQRDRARSHPDDDLRTRRPGRTCRSVDPFVRQPLHGVARTKHPRRHPRRADGALPLHARLLRRSHRSVLLPPRPRRTGASHQRPPRRTGRRAGDHRRQKQGGGKAGYAGLRPCGYAGGVRGESGKNGGGEMNMFHPLKYNIEILNRSVASSIKAFPLLIQLGNPYFMGKLSPMEAA